MHLKRPLSANFISNSCCLVLLVGLCTSAGIAAPETALSSCSGRIIVKFKEAGKQTRQLNKRQINQLQSADPDVSHDHRGVLSNGAHLLQRNHKSTQQTDAEFIAQLRKQEDIEYAECDVRRRIRYVPNDPGFPVDGIGFPDQWYLSESAGGIRAEQAWDISLNYANSASVIAIIDTGILSHQDLDTSRILPGYDFLDGDDDPSDPGDAALANECPEGGPEEDTNSSWHGTAIAGMIAATQDNGVGIAGIDHSSNILPVRALGKCGGSISIIAEAIRWAAGLSAIGVANNPYPADIINLSFGSLAPCSDTEQQAINAAVTAGALVVSSAGNESTDISETAPASCDNVLVVTATTRQGGETCYTNFGAEADLAAPGGNEEDLTSGCTGSIDDALVSISNTGTNGPGLDGYAYHVGTSFAAPMVSAAAGLVKASDPSLTMPEIETLLLSTARSFPQNTTDSFADCAQQRCGAGILNIEAALSLVILDGGLDTSPDGFIFSSQNNVATDTSIISNSITVSGINVPVPISIVGGEYSIENNSFTDISGQVAAGNTVRIQLVSANSSASTRTATLTIGDQSADFIVTTAAAIGRTSDSGGGIFNYLFLFGLCLFLAIRNFLPINTLRKSI